MAKASNYYMFLRVWLNGAGLQDENALYGIQAKGRNGTLIATGTHKEIEVAQTQMAHALSVCGTYSQSGWTIFIADEVPFNGWPMQVYDILSNPHTEAMYESPVSWVQDQEEL